MASSIGNRSNGNNNALESNDDDLGGRSNAKNPRSENSTKPRKKHVWIAVNPKTFNVKRPYIRRKSKDNSTSRSGENHEEKGLMNHRQRLMISEYSSASDPQSSIRTGGLRGDPFNAFPIANCDSIQRTVDFFLIDIAAVATPGAIRSDSFNPKVSAYMQLAFKSEACFHALITFARGYLEVANHGATEPSPMVLYHRGKATEMLYSRLKDPETSIDDISILITFMLIDNVWRYGEYDIGKAHYAGLMKMVELRGGLNNLGANGILKAVIEFAEVTDLGDSFRPSTIPNLPNLQYLRHPFPPKVCSIIAQLPVGYSEIALKGQLSLETINTIASLQNWIQSPASKRQVAPANQIGEARRCLSGIKPSSGICVEESVCLGLIITAMRMFHARFSRMDHSFLDRIVEIGESLDITDPRQYKSYLAERRHFAYLAMVAIEASEICIELRGHVKRLVDMLVQREVFALRWETLEGELKRFFWIKEGRVMEKWRVSWLNQLEKRQERLEFEQRRSEFGSISNSDDHSNEAFLDFQSSV